MVEGECVWRVPFVDGLKRYLSVTTVEGPPIQRESGGFVGLVLGYLRN